MRKKTALRTPQQRETSVRKQGGLIVQGENAQDSATAKSTLTNRSHRTHIRQLVFCPVAASRLNLRRSRLAKPRPLNLHHRAKMARSGARAPAGQTLRGSQPRTARSLRRTALRAGASPALQCVRRAPHTQAAPVQDVGVDHRGADVPMPQQLLHRADVGTGVE